MPVYMRPTRELLLTTYPGTTYTYVQYLRLSSGVIPITNKIAVAQARKERRIQWIRAVTSIGTQRKSFKIVGLPPSIQGTRPSEETREGRGEDREVAKASLRREPWRPPTPFHGTWYQTTYYPFSFRGKTPSNQDMWCHGTRTSFANQLALVHVISPHVADFPIVPNNIVDSAVRKAYSKANRTVEDIGMMIAELDKTVQGLADRAGKTVGALILVSKGKFDAAARLFGVRSFRQAGSIWLEYQYGWKPLVSDIEALINLNTQKIKELQDHPVFYQKGREWQTAPKLQAAGVRSLRQDYRQEAECRLDLKIRNDVLGNLNVLGTALTAQNLARLQWARMPFSFLVDWFMPIEDYLLALNGRFQTEFLSGTITRTVRGSADWQQLGTAAGDHSFSGILPAATCEQVVTYREVLTEPPLLLPSPSPRPFSTTRLANAIALVQTLAGKNPEKRVMPNSFATTDSSGKRVSDKRVRRRSNSLW